MKKKTSVVKAMICITCILVLNGCSSKVPQENGQKEETNMQEKQNSTTGFKEFYKKELPESKEPQSAENVVKLYFYKVKNSRRSDKIAIDLQNKVVQLNPGPEHFYDKIDFDTTLSDEDVEMIVGILRDGHVVEWDGKYQYGDEKTLAQMDEGYSWYLLMQYKDGTMSVKSGVGTKEKEIQPEGYETFVKELTEFMEAKEFLLAE